MAKKKSDYLEEAQALGLDVTAKNTVAELQEAISSADTSGEKQTSPKDSKEETVAKAGKRSAKSVREADELSEKEARKEARAAGDDPDEAEVNRGPVPKRRPLEERRGKKYREAFAKIDRTKMYTLKEAVALAVSTSTTSFDSTVELHMNLNVDPTQADQNVRSTTTLPHGTGKKIRVAVFAPSADHADAKKAGADIVGEDDLLELLKKEELNFDVLIATPQLMAQLGRYAKLLGPKGLMPNPKSGTVTKNVAQAVKEAKAGKVEFRIDKQGIIHIGAAKVSFGEDMILENLTSLIAAIKAVRPPSIKGNYIQSVVLTTSMGPSVRVDSSDLT